MGQESADPLANRRMYEYQNILTGIDRYLSSLPTIDESSADKSDENVLEKKITIPEFPTTLTKTPEECTEYFEGTIREWLRVYDDKILGSFELSRAAALHDPDLCIACHIGIPLDQPLFIQYLYCLQLPEAIDPTSVTGVTLSRINEKKTTIPYEDILNGIMSLSEEDKEKFLYELRLGFLESASKGNENYVEYKKLKESGPEGFYSAQFNKKEGWQNDLETKAFYDTLVKTAKEGELYEPLEEIEQDYVSELKKASENSVYHFHSAFHQLRMMRDLILEKLGHTK